VGTCEPNRMSDSLMFIGSATVSGHLGSAKGFTQPMYWPICKTTVSKFDSKAKFLLHSRNKFPKNTIIRFALLGLNVAGV
jgi:hypothetical protein